MLRSAVRKLLQARRRWAVRRRFGIRVPRTVFIAPGAHCELNPDGFVVGGKLSIGENVRICRGAIIAPYGGSITLEDNVYIGPYAILYGHGGLRIGRDSLVAGHCFIVASNHQFSDPTMPVRLQQEKSIGITIGRDVWIGAGAKILDGVTIGDRCIIGAGAVVTTSIDPDMIAMGVPARVTGQRIAHAEGAVTATS
jgi:acetyltransferase-like isoleucine patch superfamily enzyme